MPQPIILDSITHMAAAHRGRAVLAMSHGGRYAGYHAAKMGAGAVILNDASVGRDQAGLAGLLLLDRLAVPAVAVSARSARIGDGADGYAHGILSFVNEHAAKLGLANAMPAAEALARLDATDLATPSDPGSDVETRVRIDAACAPGAEVHVVDSAALVLPEDNGQIVVTASHGGVLGSKPATALKHDAFAAVFCDAGFGKDDAGVSRLPALEARGIAAACVSAFSCHIGDGASVYRDGVVSAINQTAARHGGEIGQTCRAFVRLMVAAKLRALG